MRAYVFQRYKSLNFRAKNIMLDIFVDFSNIVNSKILVFLGCGTYRLYLANSERENNEEHDKSLLVLLLWSSSPFEDYSRAFYSHLSARKKTLESFHVSQDASGVGRWSKKLYNRRWSGVQWQFKKLIFSNQTWKDLSPFIQLWEMKTREIKRRNLLLYLNDTCLVKPPATFSSSACSC